MYSTFNHLWKQVGEHIATYRSYPRLIGGVPACFRDAC